MKRLPEALTTNLAVPAIAAPMFLVSGPDLVVATCRAGVIGTFPALNQRTSEGFAAWCDEIRARLDGNAAPWGVNLIAHATNPRLAADLTICVAKAVPLVITSLGAVSDIVQAVHGYGGLVFHDVTNLRHAEKAVAAGVDGIVAVAAGAGGHAGTLNPFALIAEIRSIFDGPLVLAGALSTGRDIAAARVMGADLAYLGTRFIATTESLASDAQKRMQIEARAADIVYTPDVSGVPANFMRKSLVAAGFTSDGPSGRRALTLEGEAKAWKSIWSAGQGVGNVNDIPHAADLCRRLISEYRDAIGSAATDLFLGRES